MSSTAENSGEETRTNEEVQEETEIAITVPRRKKSVWNKADIERLYMTTLNFSMLSGKPLESLRPMDYTFISQTFSQTTSQCICKMQEILTSGTLKPGAWGKSEDEYLIQLMQKQKLKGKQIAKALNNKFHRGIKLRTWKTARERWEIYLNPNNSKGNWTPEEDLIIMLGYKQFGKKWRKIAALCNNRIDSFVKNRFKSLILKGKSEVFVDDTLDIVDRIIYDLKGMVQQTKI